MPPPSKRLWELLSPYSSEGPLTNSDAPCLGHFVLSQVSPFKRGSN